MKVNPADLRFTQDTIASHFKAPHEHFSVREALEQIQAGKMSPNTFPRLRVISSNGYWWSVDNRRLWVFRMAKCSEITVKIVNTPHPRLDGVINVPSRLRRLSKEDFLPKVRGGQNVAASRAAPKDLHPRVADVMARSGLSWQIGGSKNVLPLANAPPTDLISRVEASNVRGSERQPGHPRGADVMARSGLSWQIRGSKNVLPLANAPPTDLISRVEASNVRGSERQPGHPRVADVMARPGLSWQIRGSQNVLPLANAPPTDLISRVEGSNVRGSKRQPGRLAFGAIEENESRAKRERFVEGFNVSGSESQSGRLAFGALEENESSVKGDRFVAAHIELPPEISNTKKNPEPSLLSFPDESDGRHLAVCAAKVSKEMNVGMGCSDRPNIGTEVSEQRVPRESTCGADFRLRVPASTDDNHGLERYPKHDLAPSSWFGRVTHLIFGCFGCA